MAIVVILSCTQLKIKALRLKSFGYAVLIYCPIIQVSMFLNGLWHCSVISCFSVYSLEFPQSHYAIYSDHGHIIRTMWLNERKSLNVLYLLIMISELGM
jgi:hypothetical protein